MSAIISPDSSMPKCPKIRPLATPSTLPTELALPDLEFSMDEGIEINDSMLLDGKTGVLEEDHNGGVHGTLFYFRLRDNNTKNNISTTWKPPFLRRLTSTENNMSGSIEI